ncbi:hypothetical protein [Microbacterium aurum]
MAGLTAVLLAVGGVVGGVAPAAVAAGDYLQIDKSVDKPLPLPGDLHLLGEGHVLGGRLP